MQHSRPTCAFKLFIPLLPTSCLLSLHPHHRLMLLIVSLQLLLPLPPDCLRVFYGMLEVSKPKVLNFYTLLHLIPLTLFVSTNLTLIHLTLSGSLDTLLCDLITLTPGLAFSLPMPSTLAAVSSYSSGRAYSSLNFLFILSLRLTSTMIMYGSTSL